MGSVEFGVATLGIKVIMALGLASCGAVVANVQANLRRLRTEKPILAETIASGKLRVVGAHHDPPTGRVVSV